MDGTASVISDERRLNGKSQGKKDMPRNGHLTWSVVYEPGVLEAVAYKKGRKIVSRVETTGEAERIVITPVRTRLPADAFRRWFLIAMIFLGIYLAGAALYELYAG